MGHQCNDASCQIHGNHGSCGCGSQSGSRACCGCQSCTCSCHGSQGNACCDFSKKFLELADCAWMEVLKEKIKDHIRQKDSKIGELAQVISDANHERWKHKKEKFQGCDIYEEKLKNLLSK